MRHSIWRLLKLRPSAPKTEKPVDVYFQKKIYAFLPFLFLTAVINIGDEAERSIEPKANESGQLMNVILISLDTVRADSLGILGNRDNITPFIDALAERGTVFSDTIATAPWTLPSHASIFTGLYPSNHGSHCLYETFTHRVPTLTEILKSSGFETISFNGGANVRASLGFDRGFSIYQSFKFKSGLTDKASYIQSDPTLPIQKGIEWIERRSHDPSREAPFFLFLHSFEPHSPYYSRREDSFTDLDDLKKIQKTGAKGDANKAHRDYHGGIHWADKYLGKLQDTLENTGLKKKTIVVLTSDHGEAFLEHGFVLHSIKLYPEFVQVPLIIVDPRKPGPKFSSKPASLVDIKPTLLDLLDLPSDPGLDGLSLVNDIDPHRPRFAEVCFDPGASNRLLKAGIVSIEDVSSKLLAKDHYRLIYNDQRDTYELYDVEKDPDATNDLIQTDVRELPALKNELQTWISSTLKGKDKPSYRRKPSADSGLSKDTVDQLKALGYIDSPK